MTDVNTEPEEDEPGTPAMLFDVSDGKPKRFACPRCQASVFTKHGEIFTCNGCGAGFTGERPSPQ